MGALLDGKVAIVTGGAQGIGKAIATLLAREGARTVVVDVTETDFSRALPRLTEAASGDGQMAFVRADVSRLAEMESAVGATVERFGRVDIACPNAGIFPQTLIDDITVEEWDAVMAVNLRGVFVTVKACLPHMRSQRYGRIVVTGSITGAKVGQPENAHYAASKAGIMGFVRTAAIEVAGAGITINAVEPGNILTEGIKKGHSPDFFRAQERAIPLGRLGDPEDVADAVLFLASDRAKYITGQSLVVDGGQILPEAKAQA